MREITVFFAVFICVSALFFAASAETSSTPSASPQGSDFIGGLIALVALIVIFSVIAYAGYKVIKKWSSQSD